MGAMQVDAKLNVSGRAQSAMDVVSSKTREVDAQLGVSDLAKDVTGMVVGKAMKAMYTFEVGMEVVCRADPTEPWQKAVVSQVSPLLVIPEGFESGMEFAM